MTQGRASLKDNREMAADDKELDSKPSTSVIMNVLGMRTSQSTKKEPEDNLRGSKTRIDAVINHYNAEGGTYGVSVTKKPDPIEMPKLKGRLSKVLGGK